MVYFPNIPAANDNISTSQPQIQANFQFLGDTTGNLLGYYRLPNGITIQWGISPQTINAGLSAELPFNIAFSAPAYFVVLTEIKNSTSATNRVVISSELAYSATGFKVEAIGGTTPNFPTKVSWLAIGPT